MTYIKTTWNDGTTPAINATNLNKIEGGIYDAHESHRDLIAGQLPTFTDWTVDPTDAVKITDGDFSTRCTTGNKVCSGGWQFCYIEYDLGAFYPVLVSGNARTIATVGTDYIFVYFYDGTNWIHNGNHNIADRIHPAPFIGTTGITSRIRFGFASDAACTLTPDIRCFNVWRLG